MTFEQYCEHNGYNFPESQMWLIRRAWYAALVLADGQKPSTNTDMAAEAAQICPVCLGSKNDPNSRGIGDCPKCGGTGKLRHA